MRPPWQLTVLIVAAAIVSSRQSDPIAAVVRKSEQCNGHSSADGTSQLQVSAAAGINPIQASVVNPVANQAATNSMYDMFFDPVDLAPLSYGSLGWLDLTWLGLYLVGLAAVTVYVNRTIGGQDAESYFLGGKHAEWWVVGFSLFASNLGTDHLVGLAGSGAAGGLVVGTYEILASPVLLILGYVFAPYYLAHNIYTTPEFLEKRFGKEMRQFFTWLSIAATIFTKVSVTIFAGAVVMQEVFGWNMWMSSTVLLLLTSVYTAIGGLAAVLYTEVLQSLFLIAGSCALLYFGMKEVGGIQGLTSKLPDSHFRLLKPLDHPDFPWLGVLVGMPINSIWYWCTDQVMAQRVLAASKPAACQSGCVFAAWLKQLPLYVMVAPGLIAAALYPREIAKDSNRAYALLVTKLLPRGWVGIMTAVMLSSFMAALASCFNSASTLFTLDVYAKMYPDKSESDLVRVGRLFTFAVACISLAWLPMIDKQNDQLFLYIQAMQVIWCAPVALVFLAARFLPDMTTWTAWCTLVVGLGVGIAFFLIQHVCPTAWLTAAGIAWIGKFNILLFAIFDFIFCSLVLAGCHLFALKSSQAERPEFDVEEVIAKQEWAGSVTNVAACGVLGAVVAIFILHESWP